jgi:hypothetical protein
MPATTTTTTAPHWTWAAAESRLKVARAICEVLGIEPFVVSVDHWGEVRMLFDDAEDLLRNFNADLIERDGRHYTIKLNGDITLSAIGG